MTVGGSTPGSPLPVLARLLPLTNESRSAIGGDEILIRHFPFKVGLESRSERRRVEAGRERRLGTTAQLNDVYLVAYTKAFEISREHFQIEATDQAARFMLSDRGSRRGALVNRQRLGGDGSGGRLELHDGDVITVGTPASPYVFRFVLSAARPE